MKSHLRIIFRNWYYLSNIKQDDVLLASFPKSGNTWLAFLVANLMRSVYGIQEEVNFFTIPRFVPETTEPWGRIPAARGNQRVRVIKTHDACSGYFRRIIWLVRNPKDVMKSYYLYLVKTGQISSRVGFREFIQSGEHGVGAWVEHAASYLKRARYNRGVVMIRYEDLREDPTAKLREIARLLGIINPDLDYSGIVRMCSRERMRTLERETRRSGVNVEGGYDFVSLGRELPEEGDLDSLIREKASGILEELGYTSE